MSGLKVNFNKSMLVGVNIADSWLRAVASALRCTVGKTPFLYLGLPIGGDPRRLGFWEPVLTRIQNRLSGWKSCFLSFGGRLVLLKSVLTSMPVYALSFFKAPSGIISSINSILIKFFWGGSEDTRKISWISWKDICSSKEHGGLGVRHLREFNLALLGKWCWRMLVDRGGLWFRVLAARYGVERGCVREGGRIGSAWWREIVRIRDGVDGLGGRWFGEGVVRKVGDGTESYFWTDPWVDTGGEAWEWRRHLWAWEEEMLGECQVLLLDITLQAQLSDTWIWRTDPVSGYSVRGAYQLLTTHPSDPHEAALDLIWHKQVPLKVSIFAWRLLRDRLPTKSNLVIRGIITSEAQDCVAGCGGMETAQHLFISCSTFGSLWSSVRSWIGFSSVDPHSLTDHFLQFTFSSGGLSVRRSFLQLIWLVCVWVIWNERNQRLFRNSEQTLPRLLDKVKLYSYWWLKTTNMNLVSNYHSWWTSPFTCLGMV
ncbi:hypothetical protein TSUD_332900 [Trifolium subterraneum]|uniref:Reverse transcriptase zinc-binding domain-containing protein n=1 Tax=Trifolium subterraneum TaxID=3900 RepID=A0A2Z6N6J9_TRISU|nr:hypothetical protein TSUD_332900 [Trifolium subterraneum]